jgi:hypothetical protein
MIWSCRRRGGWQSWRVRRRIRLERWAIVRGGQKIARRVLAMIQVQRQSDGARVLGCSGGNIGQFGRRLINQESEKQMRGDPGFGELGVFGRQTVEVKD